MITGLNHITIAVSHLENSLHFYREILGFTAHVKWSGGAYLSIGELWFCLSCDEPCPKEDYSHIAFNVPADKFNEYVEHLKLHKVTQWKENKSEGLSLYILDPDGHKLEVHSGTLQSRLLALKSQSYKGLVWL